MVPLFSAGMFLSAVLSTASAQFVPAPTDLIATTGYLNLSVRYKEVPTGICELDPNVKSYSGYVDVDENQHIFFWLVIFLSEISRSRPIRKQSKTTNEILQVL